MRKVLFRHNIADAPIGTATAWMIFEVLQIIAVVERQFLARLDVPQSGDPDAVFVEFGFAVRLAAVVDEARRIPLHAAVNVPLLVDVEDKVVVFLAPLRGLGFVNPLPDVFDNTRSGWDIALCVSARAMNARLFEAHKLIFD